MSARDRRVAAIVAGHRGDVDTARHHLSDADGEVRAAALRALDRLDELDHDVLADTVADSDALVRRTAAELIARRPDVGLTALLDDPDPTVVETAVWATGEHETVSDDVLERVIELATDHDVALVREAAAAALGAIGDPRGLPAIISACTDKPHVRRRAVLALAPFEGPDVEAALERALGDRDWQTRNSAEAIRPTDQAIE